MEAILCEDLNLKEDQFRLSRCKEYFAQIAAGTGTWNTEEILIFLYDKWSAIRQECGKQMTSVPSLVCDDLSQALCSGCVSTHWQEVHGSVLGLSALLTHADPTTHSVLFKTVSSLCIELIGHVSIPVKEAVRQCLITVQKRQPNKYNFVSQLIRIVNNTVRGPNSESEATSLKLDGLLGCLVDNYNLFPELMSQEAALHRSGDVSTSIDVVTTIRLCALHPASTVRQKAGQILTLFVLSFLKQPVKKSGFESVAAEPTAVVNVITDMLMEALRSTESAHWCLQEISLMVAEEVVCAVIDAQLEKLERLASQSDFNAPTPKTAIVTQDGLVHHTHEFLDFLKNHLHILLGHAQFEVRRMAIQLTPQLARAFVLLNAPQNALDRDNTVIAISPSLDPDSATVPPLGDQDNLHNPSFATESGDNIENRVSIESRSDGSLEDNEDGQGALHVQLNSSFRSHTETEGGGPGIDMQLITRMVWLDELIKENQHLFEAYSLSESWAGNSVTKDLQLRSYSIQCDSQKYWTEASVLRTAHGVSVQSNNRGAVSCIANNTSTKAQSVGGLARGVVDHWSLDVRGRLQEIEERVQFHRTVKSIVSTEVTTESCTVIVLLMRNCRSLLLMVDDLLQEWEVLFAQRGSWATLTDFAASLNSLRSTAAGATTLSLDFIEGLALMESFLLSVQYRFANCPDIQAACTVAAADPAGLITTADGLRQRLSNLRGDWITHVARIQCVSRCSTHVSTRSGITGQTHQRPSATQMLLTVLRQRQERLCGGNNLFGSSDLADVPNNTSTDESYVVEFLTKLVQAKMNVAESKDSHSRDNVHAVEEVLCDMFSDRVILVPSLTTASFNIDGGPSFHAHATGTGTGADAAHVLSPQHAVSSVGHTPQSSAAAHPKNVFSLSGFAMNSPGSHVGIPHGYTGAIGGSHGRYQSMDQWNCEAVSPVLTCLANATTSASDALHLSAVVVEWVVACVLNPLWLDCRHNARKNLFEALVLLLSTAEKSTADVPPVDALLCLLVLKEIRAIAEVLALRGAKPLLEQKVLICLIKAIGSAIRVFQRLEARLHAAFTTCSGVPVVSWCDVCNVQLRATFEECCSKILISLQYYREVFPQPSPISHPDLHVQLDREHHTTAATCERPEGEENTAPDSEATSTAEESDEFSDWDEESEADEDVMTTTGPSAAVDIAHSLGTILWEEMSLLEDLVGQWKLTVAH